MANIKERLDRAFANERWRLIFPRTIVQHIPASLFDHLPIILISKGEQRQFKRPFKFVEAWTIDETSSFVVEKVWKESLNGTPMFEVYKKIKETKNEFRKWNREWFGNIQTKIIEKWDLF